MISFRRWADLAYSPRRRGTASGVVVWRPSLARPPVGGHHATRNGLKPRAAAKDVERLRSPGDNAEISISKIEHILSQIE